MDKQITQFIEDVRNTKDNGRKLSSSSDEVNMDTSDESEFPFDYTNVISGKTQMQHRDRTPDVVPGTSKQKPEGEPAPKYDVQEVELNKAEMYEVPGKTINFMSGETVAQMDQDYQMIDAHVDLPTRRKIQCFEYIDFSKLIAKGKSNTEEQRLELVSKNGATFLSPVADRENVQISSNLRTYSNILTARFPQKATELLQYNHTIHTASTSYQWDNVYSYDREFRQHISRHPTRTWSVILQQAWTMILKDRIKYDNNSHKNKGGKKGEPCR